MKITIDTDILERERLSLGEALVLLLSYYGVDMQKEMASLYEKGIADRNLFDHVPPVLSDNAKEYVHKVLTESDRNVQDSDIGFLEIANEIRLLFPTGNKPGSTHPWRISASNLATRLKALVRKYNFRFTKEEAIAATKEYVSSFKDDRTHMRTSGYFIWKSDPLRGFTSDFMTIIENIRDNETSN